MFKDYSCELEAQLGIAEQVNSTINSKKESSGLRCHRMAEGLPPPKTLCQGHNGPVAVTFVLISGNLCLVLFVCLFVQVFGCWGGWGVWGGRQSMLRFQKWGRVILPSSPAFS